MKPRKIAASFNYAIEGVLYAVKSQRNMKIHFFIGILVLILAMALNVSRIELLILLLTIGLVICAEMMNTAVEEVVNLFVNDYHPIARNAKNVAAGGELISSIIAAGVGYIVLFEKLLQFDLRSLRSSFRPIDLTLVAILVVIGLSIIVKSATGSLDYLKGGMPSGHTAIAFSLATAIMFCSSTFVAVLAFVLALLVAHTRVQSKIHSLFEVAVGGLIGILVTVIIFHLRI